MLFRRDAAKAFRGRKGVIRMIHEIETRRSIRSYTDKPVPDDLILELLKAARLAPSGHNTQPWQFIIIKSPEMRKKIAAADHNQKWMEKAPVHIACIGDIRSRVPEDVPMSIDENSPQEEVKQIIRDTAAAIENILIEAESHGLSTCWTGWYTQAEMRPILGIPEDKYLVGIVAVGYLDKPVSRAPKKDLNAILHYEQW